MPSSPTRRQTCPITRGESEQLLDFFLNLSTSQKKKENENYHLNNNIESADCHCGQQRPEFMRSDSYRKATQRYVPSEDVSPMTPFKKENYDRKKYLSLPVNTTSKGKHVNNNNTNVSKKNKLNRQKSGTVPSSDSDNQTSPPENRKKKSVFQRTKERIFFKIRKEKKYSDDKKKSNENKQDIGFTERRTTNSHQLTALGVDTHKGQTTVNNVEIIEPKRAAVTTNRTDYSRKSSDNQTSPLQKMSPSISPSRGRRFKTQISREEITNTFEKILSSAEVRDEPFKFPSEQHIKRAPKRKDFSPVRDISYADGIKNKKSGLKLDIVPFTPDFTREEHVTVIEDRQRTSLNKDGSVQTVHEHRQTTYDRTFSIEQDGVDDIDGPIRSPSEENKKSQAEGGCEEALSPTEQEKMIEEIARRLDKIADDCVQRMSHGEPPERTDGPVLSPNSRSRKLANDLVAELRREGDRLSRELNLPDTLLPVVMGMVKQITYDHFKELVKKALCDTIGWDQVAMCLYVSRAAILMAGAGSQIARKLKDMAVRYFHEEICPWVYERGGYEIMLEETDSEVD